MSWRDESVLVTGGASFIGSHLVDKLLSLFMDGDCTYDPKDIRRLLNHADHYSHVIGARDKRHIPLVHRLGNWVISKTFTMLFGVNISDVCSGMYLLETEEARKYCLENGVIDNKTNWQRLPKIP